MHGKDFFKPAPIYKERGPTSHSCKPATTSGRVFAMSNSTAPPIRKLWPCTFRFLIGRLRLAPAIQELIQGKRIFQESDGQGAPWRSCQARSSESQPMMLASEKLPRWEPMKRSSPNSMTFGVAVWEGIWLGGFGSGIELSSVIECVLDDFSKLLGAQ